MVARRIFFQGYNFTQKKVDNLFLVVALITQVLTVTANAQNTLLYNISRRRGQVPPYPYLRAATALISPCLSVTYN